MKFDRAKEGTSDKASVGVSEGYGTVDRCGGKAESRARDGAGSAGPDKKDRTESWPGAERLACFTEALRNLERCDGTIEKYVRDVKVFGRWLDKQGMTESQTAGTAWKESLIQQGYEPATINSMVCAVNSFFRLTGNTDIQIRTLRVQRRMFWEEERELDVAEFRRLLQAARQTGKKRLAMLMETVAGTGIRISELKYITVEAVQKGKTKIWLKGKTRVILIPRKLCRKLRIYAEQMKIKSGVIFCTGQGRPLSRKQVWAEMKALGQLAGVASSKIFPHNLRHLFARCFYGACGDLVGLSNILGHSSIETTRIYLLTTEARHVRQMEQLQLIC